MYNNEDGMATINLNGVSYQGETLKKFLDYCFRNCDTISLSQSSNIGMTKSEADRAIEEYNKYLQENGLSEGLYPSDEEMLEVYKNIAETEEELKSLIQRDKDAKANYEANFKLSEEAVESYVNENFAGYDLVNRDVTCMTPSTYGGPKVMYYFRPEENLLREFYNMKTLFDSVIKNDEKQLLLDDPTFYREGKILLLVCSHEKYASLFVNEKLYNEFAKLGIKHRVGYDFNG
ncbi:MAG: hypothetical protein GX359_03085 [Clostridiales bacterium]|nr:hypothetical protein [Clostridiales bacterium]